MVFIPYIFPKSEETLTVDNWFSLLTQNPTEVQNCHVTRVVHVKDLASWLSHEYLYFIVKDRVVIGHWKSGIWPQASKRSIASTQISLPLASLTFKKPLSIAEFARVLRATTTAAPRYNITSYNCYWFSHAAFLVFKRDKENAVYSNWPWSSWVLGRLIWRTSKYREGANSFKKVYMETNPDPVPCLCLDADSFCSKFPQGKFQAEGQIDVGEEAATATSGDSEVYDDLPKDIDQLRASLTAKPLDADNQTDAANPEGGNQDIQGFYAAVFADSAKAEADRDAYRKATKGDEAPKEPEQTGELVDAYAKALKDLDVLSTMTDQDSKMLDDAIDAIVGRVLREIDELLKEESVMSK